MLSGHFSLYDTLYPTKGETRLWDTLELTGGLRDTLQYPQCELSMENSDRDHMQPPHWLWGYQGAACPRPPSAQPQPAPGEFSAAKVPSQGTGGQGQVSAPASAATAKQSGSSSGDSDGWLGPAEEDSVFKQDLQSWQKKYFTYTRKCLGLTTRSSPNKSKSFACSRIPLSLDAQKD